MAEVGSAFVSILPSAKGFGRKLEGDVKGEVSGAGRSMGSTFGNLFKVGALAALGGAVLLGKFLKGSLDEAREAQVITARTENVIAKMGNAAGVSATQVADLAGSISAKTGIDDEAIQSGQNLLLTFGNIRNEAGKGNDIFSQTSQLMVDMSTAMGTDANGAAIQLGKALNDPIKGLTALSRVGVSFTEGQKATITSLVESGNVMGAQKVILGELERQFGGAAAAMATPADKARVAYGNLKEQIGTALLPVLDGLLSKFVSFAPTISALVAGIGPAFGKVKEFLAPIGAAIASFVASIAPAFVALATQLPAALSAGLGVVRGLVASGGGPLKPLIAAAQGLVLAFVGAGQKIVPALVSIVSALLPIGKALAAAAVVALTVAFRALAPVVTAAGTAIAAIGKFVSEHETLVRRVVVVIGSLFVPALILMGTTAVVNAAKSAVAWALSGAGAVKAALMQSVAFFQIIAGWVAQGAAAVASGAITTAIWLMLKMDAIKSVAAQVVAFASIAAGWVSSAAAATASGALTAAAWLISKVGAVGSVVAHVAAFAVMVAGWVASGVAAMAGALVMAAAWLIALGPIGLVIAAVVALVVAIILNWDKVKAATVAVWNAIKSVLSAVWDGIKAAASAVWNAIKSVITTVWNVIKTVVTTYVNAVKTVITTVFNAIKSVTSTVWNAIKAVITTVWNVIKTVVTTYVNAVKTVVTTIWNAIKSVTSTVWNAIKAAISAAINAAKAAVSTAIDGIKSAFGKLSELVGKAKEIFGNIVTAIKDKIGQAIDFVSTFPGRVANTLGDLGSVLYEKGKALVQGLIDGIGAMIQKVKDKIAEVAGAVKDFFPGSPVKEGPLTSWNNGGAGKSLMEMLAKGIADNADAPADEMTKAAEKLLEALESKRDKIKSILDSLKSDFASLRDGIADTFAGDLFNFTAIPAQLANIDILPENFADLAPEIQRQLMEEQYALQQKLGTPASSAMDQFMQNLMGTKGNLKKLMAAFKKLVKWGLPADFLSQLFASGNGGLILEMAGSSKQEANDAAQLFGQVDSLSNQLGGQVARNELGPKIDRQTAVLADIRHDIRQLHKRIGEEINDAAAGARRRGRAAA